jgi:hypothetical protein
LLALQEAFSFLVGVKNAKTENWCQEQLADQILWSMLREVDQEFADKTRAEGCRHCLVGKVHSARYRRKPRGRPDGADLEWRFSFCCDQPGCRRRSTPPSVRFLGPRQYTSLIVVLLSAMRHGLSDERVHRLRECLRVDRRTLERWRDF